MISIIDDDLSLQSALVRLVRSLGYSARGFASAEEFLETGFMPKSSCVITDIHMPGMSGIDLMRVLEKRGSCIPVILITARTETVLEENAVASGAHCFLRKPIDTEVLSVCIERALKP
ncbi:response regulator [Phyllobacterium phragmitis]|uniref:Response regulator n=1 Tax=Phyllobacterium phragmitis TaxID=2670329 RepID=A0A2S9IRS7_9HYPH|nr:response regulator [Phyllobacterium phragmitis]